MLFSWDKDTIRWYESANNYTGFYKNLADEIEPMVKGAENFADLGCGLGLVDLELAERLKRICCVDVSEPAIARLRENAVVRDIDNLEILLHDCFELNREFDVIYLCFFSSRELERFLPMCRKLVSIVGGESNAPLFPQKYRKKKRNTVAGEKLYLEERNISYKLTECAFEFGQPFTSVEDAHAYIRTYAPEIDLDEMNEFLDQRCVDSELEEYSFYIPRKKSIGIFEVDGLIK